ncbi:MAG: zinc ribbon domain-containing protein [Parafannyhessea sp.]|uniref:zinc ribbon domain-containing protein n=1 Tax=Parafannyhessea sp. TaxID=2847324 RepID=UPI003F0FE7AB
MICPNCGSNIPDGLAKCPACHVDLEHPKEVHKAEGVWCESCGSLVPDGATVCPHCGMPVGRQEDAGIRESAIEAGDATGDLSSDRERTNVMPRIESAIPPEDDGDSPVAEHDRMPRARVLLITMGIAVAAVCGFVLLVTHPWNPEAFDTRAKTDASTSMAGFPGTITELKGQDSSASSDSTKVTSGDDASYKKLSSYYKKLVKLEAKVDASEKSFDKVAYSGTQTERQSGYENAQSLVYEISNLIDDIKQVDVTSGTYADDRSNLTSLGNYMRNRMDALYDAWKRCAKSTDPQADQKIIAAPLTDTDGSSITDRYKKLFEENYKDWKPQKKSS